MSDTPLIPISTSSINLTNEKIIMADPEAFIRLEGKVDKLSEALTELIRFEERQTNQGMRIGEIEKFQSTLIIRFDSTDKRIDTVDRKVDQWVNRGIGVWALAVTLWGIYQQFSPLLTHH